MNMMTSEHKATNPKYRENYDRIFNEPKEVKPTRCSYCHKVAQGFCQDKNSRPVWHCQEHFSNAYHAVYGPIETEPIFTHEGVE